MNTLVAMAMSELESTLVSLHSGCQYSTTLCEYMDRTMAAHHKTLTKLEMVIKEWGMLDAEVV